MQVDPVKPKLKLPRTQRLKLKRDEPLSNFAFKFNLRRYIVVLTHGGSTARLVAKYRASVPVLAVFVPTLTTDSLTWTCSGETPARQANLSRGLIPLLAEGSARATDTDTTDEILSAAIQHAKAAGYCNVVGRCRLTLSNPS